MDLNSLYMITGFLLAAYSVVANDSIQTLGTFISSQRSMPWYILWLAASSILILCLGYSWMTNNGDVSFGRLDSIPQPEQYNIFHVIAPLTLLFLTRFGVPVSTTFLVLSVFADSVVLEKVLLKSITGYAVAAVFAYGFWFVLSRLLNEHLPVTDEKHKKLWRIAQWFATGFLWASWLMHDMANIAVYFPRKMELFHLALMIGTLVLGLGYVFKSGGGAIQKIILNKSGTRYVRSATIIDIAYAFVLLFFIGYSKVPMSTSWVFVGLLCGRELAVYSQHDPEKHIKTVFPIVARDFFKLLIGLSLSVALVICVMQIK